MIYRLIVLSAAIVLSLNACTSASNTEKLHYQAAVEKTVPTATNSPLALEKNTNTAVKLIPLSTTPKLSGIAAVKKANTASILEPSSDQYSDAAMYFNYQTDALYQVYCMPLTLSDLVFQPGEEIISVAAGDTDRWQVSKTISGSGQERSMHLLVKPTEDQIHNVMIVTTDRHVYHILLSSNQQTYMPIVKWQYPQLASLIKNQANPLETNPVSSLVINAKNLNSHYQIQLLSGEKPSWYPLMVFNDGEKTYIRFPNNMQEAPSLFVGNDSSNDQLVNYRSKDHYYIVDELFKQAQLRLGDQHPIIIQISYSGETA